MKRDIKQLRYENMVFYLPQFVPEIQQTFDLEEEWWGDEEMPPHCIYGDVLTWSTPDKIE